MKFPRTVYALEHALTGRIYVGSTSNMKGRLAAHLSGLKNGKHPCELMQKDYNELGDGYLLIELDTINGWDDRWKEYRWMESLHTDNPEHGYNGNDNHFTRRRSAILRTTLTEMC